MKAVGMTLWIVGALVFFVASAFFDTTVSNYSTSLGSIETFNIGLQQNQMLAAMAGLTMFLSGAIIHCLATLFGQNAEPARNEAPIVSSAPAHTISEPSAGDLQDEMNRLGVVKDGDQYGFGRHRYDRLSDALRYAGANQSERD